MTRTSRTSEVMSPVDHFGLNPLQSIIPIAFGLTAPEPFAGPAAVACHPRAGIIAIASVMTAAPIPQRFRHR